MITLTSELEQFMKGQNLEGLKPFAVLLRNKWVEEESASESESGSVGHYELDTANPIDITGMIVKPNTLSMTLDVNEIAQYNANNVTLTLSDTKNQLVEGTENSFFPSGYQLYGSRVVLYYGTDDINKTRIFTGVIKDLPTYKPEQYQVDLKLVSPLEMLKDIEAKDFSDKVIGETLTYIEDDSDGHRIYNTSGFGVGGFDAVYADGTKLFEGVDYEVDNLSVLNHPAVVTIINSDIYSATITADYYTWKTKLSVEQIITGLVSLAGYTSATEDISTVIWNTGVRNPDIRSGVLAAIGYYEDEEYHYKFNWKPTSGVWQNTTAGSRTHTLPNNFDYSFQLNQHTSSTLTYHTTTAISIGDSYNGNEVLDSSLPFGGGRIGLTGVLNGISVRIMQQRRTQQSPYYNDAYFYIHQISNGTATLLYKSGVIGAGAGTINPGTFKISRRGSNITFYLNDTQLVTTTISSSLNYEWQGFFKSTSNVSFQSDAYSQNWNIYDDDLVLRGAGLTNPCIVSAINDKTIAGDSWFAVKATLEGDSSDYFLNCYFSENASTWSEPLAYSLNTSIGRTERYLYFILGINNAPNLSFDISDLMVQYISTTLTLDIVNLTGLTVLEALQDFALISGYEFGVDRQGVFFFRPRVASTTPTYTLGHSEIAKVDTVKRNFSDFFTKLTLTFSQRPLEFYANTGESPTLVDKYGVINKEIDKPDIVNYDNPELAQAIGPQLLEVYSSLPNVIQVTGKLNLALELGDIVSLQRNYSLIEPNSASDYIKFINQQTYYRACKITGMNYNFAKKQITYTLRDVSNTNNMPGPLFNEYVYDYPIEFGVKE